MGVHLVWEWWSLTFDLPLVHYNSPNAVACTATSILSATPPPPNHPPPKSPMRPLNVATLLPSMDTAKPRKLPEENHKDILALVVCRLLLFAFIVRS